MNNIGYDYDPRGDPMADEPVPTALCSFCGQGIYSWEEYGVWGGRRICPDCADEEWSALTPSEKLCALGYEIVRRRT